MFTDRWRCVAAFAAAVLCSVPPLEAATITVAAGGDLQAALNQARPGDTVLLQANAEFVGNFVLPAKTGDGWITVRTSTPDSSLPRAGYRIKPADKALLARLRSPNEDAALRTAPGAHHWNLRYLEFRGNQGGFSDILQIGDGSSAQNSLSLVPHHIVLDHLYIHGDPYLGQKRGIALNAANVTIRDSHISDCKGFQDTQAIGGWNGPGPYLIENNYLEAAGENVMFGGADPAIPDLVADGVTVRRNYFSRPMSWRNAIIATPSGLSASAVSGGSLPAGVYGYRVVAKRLVQNKLAQSKASAEVTVTTTVSGAVRVSWPAIPGTTEYWVYGRTPGAQASYWVVSTAEFIDTGAAGTAGTVPSSTGTVWVVKNIFELKNARNVVLENNILENHWMESQPGWAIVLTPRNSNGGCDWCVVEGVRIEGNIVRNVAAGVNLLGHDNGNPSEQGADIAVVGNLFTGLTTALGGKAWAFQVGDGPRDVVIEHNTIDSNGNTVLYAYGKKDSLPWPVYGFKYRFNAARHGSYGINSSSGYGLLTLNAYFPGYEFKTNYLAGASASRYPPGTLVTAPFEAQYVDSPGGTYTVRDSSILKGAAEDGSDVGVDYAALMAATDGVEEGRPAGPSIPRPPVASFSFSCQYLVCTFTDESDPGSGSSIDSASWSFGDGTPVVSGSQVTHSFAGAGSYSVTLTVTSSSGQDSETKPVAVVAPPTPPVAGMTVSCSDLSCDFADASTPGSGAITSRTWTFGDGTPAVTASSGTHTYAAAGTYVITLTVRDSNGLTDADSETVAVAPGVAKLHVRYSGITTKWTSPSGATNYWSATVTAVVHDSSEQPIAGAAVTAAWTGAVVKTVTCVTDAAGTCVLKSGTLSYGRSTVTLNVTAVAAPGSVYEPASNHNQAGTKTLSITLNRP